MATLYWTGAADHSTFATAGNWNTQRDGGGSAASPGAGDTLYIEATNDAIAGAATGITIANMYVTFGGSVGSAGTPLTIGVTGTMKFSTSNGTHYVAPRGALSSGNEIILLHIARTGGGKVYIGGTGGVTTLYTGPETQWDVGASVVVTTWEGDGVGNVAAGTAFTTATQTGGLLATYRGATTMELSGTATTLGTAATVTTAKVLNGGQLNHWSSATITNCNVWPKGYATAKGSAYTGTVTNRKTYSGGRNFDDSSTIILTNDAIDIGQ